MNDIGCARKLIITQPSLIKKQSLLMRTRVKEAAFVVLFEADSARMQGIIGNLDAADAAEFFGFGHLIIRDAERNRLSCILLFLVVRYGRMKRRRICGDGYMFS